MQGQVVNDLLKITELVSDSGLMLAASLHIFIQISIYANVYAYRHA